MDFPSVIWLVTGLLFIGSAAFLAALEAVLWQVPRSRMDQWPRSPRLQMLAADFAHPRDCLFTFLMVTAGVMRALGWWMLWLAARGLATVTHSPAWAWILGLLGTAALLEVIPAFITARRPRAWEFPLLRVGGLLLRLFGPLFDRVQPAVAAVASRLFPWSEESRPPLDTAEVETLVWQRQEKGEFTLPEAEILSEVLQLSRQTVRQYMTPRVDVIFVEDGLSNDEARALLHNKRLLRAPVIGETPDEILGLIDTRALGRLPAGMHFTEALLPPSFVPETMEASQLLSSFLKHRQPMAVVMDEFGGVEGVVTLEDFIEELLGEAAPRAETDLYIERTGDGLIRASGAARLEDLGEYLGFDAQREGIETIGGYIINTLGKWPVHGSTIPLGPWTVTVQNMTQRRVREVLLQRTDHRSAEGAVP